MCAWYQWRPGEGACQEKSKIKGEERGKGRTEDEWRGDTGGKEAESEK